MRKYIYGDRIDEPFCMVNISGETETKYYYHFDGLGSVVALSNNDGVIVEQYRYDVFGQPNATGSVGNRYFFTGREYDKESAINLYYYRARFYRPSIGRFLQADPIGYKGGLNLYTYCKNNSILLTDPYGLIPEFGSTENCLIYCKSSRDNSLSTVKWLFDSAKKGLDKIRDQLYKACDMLPSKGCPNSNDPFDAKSQCKFLADLAHGAAMTALMAQYDATLGAIWTQYGACAGSCYIYW